MATAQNTAAMLTKQNKTKQNKTPYKDGLVSACPPFYSWRFSLSPDRTMSVLSILLLMCLWPANPTRAARLLEVIYEWKDMEFAFPSPSARDALLKTGSYIPGNSYSIDVDAWLQGKCAKSLSTRNHRQQRRRTVTHPHKYHSIPITLKYW